MKLQTRILYLMVFLQVAWIPEITSAEKLSGPETPTSLDVNESDNPVSLKKAKPVVITSSRNSENSIDEVIHVQTIGSEYLSFSGSNTMADALSFQPGLYVNYDSIRGETVSMGGLPSDYSLILINGRRVIGKNDGATNLSRLNLFDVDRIEVVKGGSSAIYGSEAIGGVVNIITRPVEEQFEYKISAGGGELGRFNLDTLVGTRNEILSNKTDISFRQLEKYNLTPDEKLKGRGFGQWQVFNQTTVQAGKNWELGAEVNAVQRNEDGVNLSGTSYLNENKESQIIGGTLFSKSQLTPSQELLADVNYSYFFDRYIQDYHDPVKKDTTTDTKEYYGSGLLHYSWGWLSNNTLTLGTENIWEKMESDRITSGGKERTRHAVYAENKWIILRDYNMIFQPAIRYDYSASHQEAVSPRIGFRFDPVADVTLKLGYGWGFRAPSLKEMNYDFVSGVYRILGNSELKPEVSETYSGTVIYRIAKPVQVSGAVFYHKIQDKINRVFDKKVGATQYFLHTNIDTVESLSAELATELSFWRYYGIKLGYTYTEAKDKTTNRVLDGQAQDVAMATFSFNHRRYALNITASFGYYGQRPFYSRSTGQTIYQSPYGDIQARISKGIARGVSMFLTGENLTNEYNETSLVRPPRSFWAGIVFQNF